MRPGYPAPLEELVSQLRRLPGIGPRSAERIALWMVGRAESRALGLARAIERCAATIRPCVRCGFFAESERCAICEDPARDPSVLCVVEQATDILPIERTGVFRGRYHALGGRIAPLDHIGPEQLRIPALLERIRLEHPGEVILALNADVEGEATSHYLAELLRPLVARVSRIAQGLPAGGGLEHSDQVTLSRALAGRTAW